MPDRTQTLPGIHDHADEPEQSIATREGWKVVRIAQKQTNHGGRRLIPMYKYACVHNAAEMTNEVCRREKPEESIIREG